MTHRTPPLLALAATAALVAGCGSDGDKKSEAAAATPTSEAPYGTYVRHVSRGDIRRTAKHRDEHAPQQSAPPPGDYRLVIAQGAGQDVIKAIDAADTTDAGVAMDMTAEDGVLRLTSYVDLKATFCGPEAPMAAHYAFSASGSTLKLSPERPDLCADRDSILTGTWTKR